MAEIQRRDFLKVAGALAGGLVSGNALSQGSGPKRVGSDKGTVAGLFDRGQRATYSGTDLNFIGMPIGGICAGQVNLGGDGQLWLWDIFNRIKFGVVEKSIPYAGRNIHAGDGANYVEAPTQTTPFAHGFAIEVDGKQLPLNKQGFHEVTFTGEYPMAFVTYKDSDCPVQVNLESFTPFIPLDAHNSGLPVVMMRYTVTNTSKEAKSVSLGGWMDNPVLINSGTKNGRRVANPSGSGVVFSFIPDQPKTDRNLPPIQFEDWSKKGYEGWTVEGNAFGKDPYKLSNTKSERGPGQFSARSYRLDFETDDPNVDSRKGRLLSRSFTIERKFIEFWIAGGKFPDTAGLRLLVDGKVVRSATGQQDESLRLTHFDVQEFEGKTAQLEVLDNESRGWGQTHVARIRFVDQPSQQIQDLPDFGTIYLGIVEGGVTEFVNNLGADAVKDLFGKVSGEHTASAGVRRTFDLKPGQSKTLTMQIAWCFPNLDLKRPGLNGLYYGKDYHDAVSVAKYVEENAAKFYTKTKLWHDTWYDSTLPYWFLDRTMANTSILASMTCTRFQSGRFYAWEGIGCCEGTCGHVWAYAQAVGRLFPELERSVREQADYEPTAGFNEKSGAITFRGEFANSWAADSQAGYILRTYREHQTSPDSAFLKRVYPRMKKALQFLIKQDADNDGILEGQQHNTLDVDLFGPSSWLSSYYLAALRAGEEMAKEMGDAAFAKQCRSIFSVGSSRFVDIFWNGEYFIHKLDVDAHPEGMRIGNGCSIDQLMGQMWAHQVGLGRVVDAGYSKKALKALYKYNFLSDIGPFRQEQKAGRWYAVPGEAGLLMCTFPRGDRKEILGGAPTWASMYFNEVWTGCEYEAAGHMIDEGLTEEGFRVVKAAHDRHHPSKRNPWNEVECSDHYARAMASYGAFISACGFTYHGPKGEIGFAPKVPGDHFRAAFTAAEGWGTYDQKVDKMGSKHTVELKHGKLRLTQLTVTAKGTKISATHNGAKLAAMIDSNQVVKFKQPVNMKEGDKLTVQVSA